MKIFMKHGFLQNGRHNSYQTYWYGSSTCEQPPAEKLQLYHKINTCSCQLKLTAAVRLFWFLGHFVGKYEANNKRGRLQSEVSTMCIPSIRICIYTIVSRKGPSIKYPPTPHYCFNILQRSKVYPKKRPPNWPRAESFRMQHDARLVCSYTEYNI